MEEDWGICAFFPRVSPFNEVPHRQPHASPSPTPPLTQFRNNSWYRDTHTGQLWRSDMHTGTGFERIRRDWVPGSNLEKWGECEPVEGTPTERASNYYLRYRFGEAVPREVEEALEDGTATQEAIFATTLGLGS